MQSNKQVSKIDKKTTNKLFCELVRREFVRQNSKWPCIQWSVLRRSVCMNAKNGADLDYKLMVLFEELSDSQLSAKYSYWNRCAKNGNKLPDGVNLKKLESKKGMRKETSDSESELESESESDLESELEAPEHERPSLKRKAFEVYEDEVLKKCADDPSYISKNGKKRRMWSKILADNKGVFGPGRTAKSLKSRYETLTTNEFTEEEDALILSAASNPDHIVTAEDGTKSIFWYGFFLDNISAFGNLKNEGMIKARYEFLQRRATLNEGSEKENIQVCALPTSKRNRRRRSTIDASRRITEEVREKRKIPYAFRASEWSLPRFEATNLVGKYHLEDICEMLLAKLRISNAKDKLDGVFDEKQNDHVKAALCIDMLYCYVGLKQTNNPERLSKEDMLIAFDVTIKSTMAIIRKARSEDGFEPATIRDKTVDELFRPVAWFFAELNILEEYFKDKNLVDCMLDLQKRREKGGDLVVPRLSYDDIMVHFAEKYCVKSYVRAPKPGWSSRRTWDLLKRGKDLSDPELKACKSYFDMERYPKTIDWNVFIERDFIGEVDGDKLIPFHLAKKYHKHLMKRERFLSTLLS